MAYMGRRSNRDKICHSRKYHFIPAICYFWRIVVGTIKNNNLSTPEAGFPPKLKPLASHGNPCQHSSNLLHCGTQRQCRNDNHKR